MALPKGTVVKVVKEDNTPDGCHSFLEGMKVTAEGVDYGRSTWQLFVTEDGESQWLLDEHFEVLDVVPAKAVYAIIGTDNEVLAATPDREYARDLKSILGGKRKGVRIYKYSAVKEIR